MSDEELDNEIYTLTDENGEEHEFELLAQGELNGTTYIAMIPCDEQDENSDTFEYVILKADKDENGEEIYVTIDNDEEFDDAADYFDDLLQSEDVDYDEKSDNNVEKKPANNTLS